MSFIISNEIQNIMNVNTSINVREQMLQSVVDTMEVNDAIIVQSQLCRDLKSAKASKVTLDDVVMQLIALKRHYKYLTGVDWTMQN